MRVRLGEETREFPHPDHPEIRAVVVIPERDRIAELSQRVVDASEMKRAAVESVKASTEVLAELVQTVHGLPVDDKNGQPIEQPTSTEWAQALASRHLNFRREDFVLAWLDQPKDKDGQPYGEPILKDPDSGIALKDGQHRIWMHPETGRIGEYVFESPEADEPVRRIRTVNYADHIVASVLRNAPDDDAGKDSPTLSADR